MQTYEIRPMGMDDYEAVVALWRACPGVGLSADDEREGIARLLAANPGLSFVALAGEQVVGAVLGSQDGRRGYLTHLAVRAGFRRLGLGEALVERCLAALGRLGISKCHIFVYADNGDGRAFWREIGWVERDELLVMSKMIPALEPEEQMR